MSDTMLPTPDQECIEQRQRYSHLESPSRTSAALATGGHADRLPLVGEPLDETAGTLAAEPLAEPTKGERRIREHRSAQY
jgi:hypothetical protein